MFYVAQSLMTLQFLYGIIPNIQGKGDCAKVSKYQSSSLSKNKHLDQLPKKYVVFLNDESAFDYLILQSNSIVKKYYCEYTVLTDYKLIECSKIEFRNDFCYK